MNDQIKKLDILDSQVVTEFENIHEYLFQKERSIRSLIEGIKTDIELAEQNEVNTMLVTAYEDDKKRHPEDHKGE